MELFVLLLCTTLTVQVVTNFGSKSYVRYTEPVACDTTI